MPASRTGVQNQHGPLSPATGGRSGSEHEKRGESMNAKEKAPTHEATRAEAVETAAFGGAAISFDQCNMLAAERQIKIADCLGNSPESAVTGRELCALTGLDSRTIRAQIERERRSGALIVSDNKSGYWLTDDPAEAQRFARSMLHRSREIARTARAVEKAAGLL